MSFGLQRVVLGTWSRDGHVLPPSWERAVLRLTITGPSYGERLTKSDPHRCEPQINPVAPFVYVFPVNGDALMANDAHFSENPCTYHFFCVPLQRKIV